MATARTIRCRVVVVDAPTETGFGPNPARPESESRTRPSEMLPWADPYIAGLVRKLQAEVREEVATKPKATTQRLGAPVADLEWPWAEATETTMPGEAAGSAWGEDASVDRESHELVAV
ncbi:MAG: hypothetical protein AAGJ46_00600 [Planctomycetota bacterium]